MTTRHRRDIGPAIVAQLEARVARHGITLNALCAKVDVHPSLPLRWRRGSTPMLGSYVALTQELDQMDRDKEENA